MRTNGPELELIACPAADAASAAERPPLLFLHGAFCGAWVWEPFFLPYFAARGYDVWAMSLRGHGNSGGHERLAYAGLSDYAADLADVVRRMPRPPMLIGHSMGAMVAQRFLADHARDAAERLAGLALVSPVPPDGLGAMFAHLLAEAPSVFWEISFFQRLGPRGAASDVLHEAFFSAGMPHLETACYVPMMQKESMKAVFDMMVPGLHAVPGPWAMPVLVMGGDADTFTSVSALRRTAEFHSADLRLLEGVPHALMLDATWERPAGALLDWLAAVH